MPAEFENSSTRGAYDFRGALKNLNRLMDWLMYIWSLALVYIQSYVGLFQTIIRTHNFYEFCPLHIFFKTKIQVNLFPDPIC